MARRRRYRGGGVIGTATAMIVGIVGIVVALYAGNETLEAVGTSIGNFSASPFHSGLEFLGMNEGDGSWTTTGIVGVLALIVVAGFVVKQIRKSFK